MLILKTEFVQTAFILKDLLSGLYKVFSGSNSQLCFETSVFSTGCCLNNVFHFCYRTSADRFYQPYLVFDFLVFSYICLVLEPTERL